MAAPALKLRHGMIETAAIRFGPAGRFELQPQQRRLLVDGAAVKLGARAFDLLALLAGERHRTLARDELLARVWPGVVVEPNNLEVQVWALRRVLGADAIATVPGRGYRFTAPVHEPAPEVAPAVPATEPGSAAAAAAASAASAAAAPLVRLIGRDDELATLQRLLTQARLVTVTGAGGVGKTLLLRHLLHRLATQQRLDTCWVELAALSDAGQVLPAVAAALGVPLGAADPQQALAAAAAPLEVVVALDNAETAPDGAIAAAQALLARAPKVRVVVTSQLPLRVAGEHLLHLDGLALPAPDADAAAVLRAPAVVLLAERARQLRPDFVLQPSDAEAAAAICRAVDGSALAIELAAARVPLIGTAAVARALAEPGALLDALGRGRRDAPPRQGSLRAALAWSHGLLDAASQAVFRGLAVFAGGASLAHAERVLAGPELDRWAVLRALDDLLERSLLALAPGEAPRYRLLEAPLALAREQLAAAPDAEALRTRHAQVVLGDLVTAFADVNAGRARYDDFIALAEGELDNARAAFDWALTHAPALAVAAARPLGNALGVARLADTQRLYDRTEPLLERIDDDALRLQWLLGATSLFSLREPLRSMAFAERAAALARTLGDATALARALGAQAACRQRREPEFHRAAMAEALALERDDWPPFARMHVAIVESGFAFHDGQMERCRGAVRRWLHWAEACGSSLDRDVAAANLADIELASGDVAEAARLARGLVARWQGTRQVRALALARLTLAAALLAADDAPAARAVAVEAWPAAAAWLQLPDWSLVLAGLAALEGRPRAAALLLGFAEQGYARAGDRLEPLAARLRERVLERLGRPLDAAALAALRAQGATLDAERAGALGLATDDGEGATP